MSSTLAGFVQRNKPAVIATAAVVTVGAGVGAYYMLKSGSPSGDGSSPSGTKAGSPTQAGEKTSKSKKKNDKKKKKKNNNNNNNNASTVGGFSVTKDSDSSPEYPVVNDFSSVKSMEEEERKQLALQFKAAGNAAFNSKKFDRAIELYTSAIKCYDKDPIFYSNRAACYNGLKEYEKVIEDTTTALTLKPDYVKCLSRRAVAYEKLERYRDAIFDFTATCILDNFQDKNLNTTVDRVIRLQAEKLNREEYSGKPDMMPSANFVKAYLQSFTQRPVPESVQNAAEGSGDYYLKLAFDAMDKETAESYTQAHEYFQKAVDNNASNLALALEYTGTFKFLLNDMEGALRDIEKSIATEPSVYAYIKRSSIHMEQGSITSANLDFDSALRLDKDASDVFYHRAQVAFLTNDFNSAIKDYERSSELNPDFMYSHIQLAVTHYRMGSIQTAISSFRELLKKFPNSSDVHNYFGEILLDQGSTEEAIKEFDIAIELEKNKKVGAVNVLPLVNKSLAVFRETQSISQAETLCKKAVTLDPSSDVAIGTLAQYCLQQNKTEEALKYFEQNAKVARSDGDRIQSLSYAEAARTQLRIVKERPELSRKLEQYATAGGAAA